MKTTARLLALFTFAALFFVAAAPLQAAKKQAAEATPALLAALDKMETQGVINEDQKTYFTQNAVKGRTIEAAKLKELFAAMAKHLGCTDNSIDAQLAALQKNKVIKTTETWKRAVAPGKKGNGGFVSEIIVNFSKKL